VYFQQALEAKPNDIGLTRNLAIALRGVERFADAIPLYRQVIDKDPNDAGAYFDLASCYEKMGQTDDAVKAYERYAVLIKDKDPSGAQKARDRAGSLKNP
jgi:Flp pilus assembly protein TadD